MFRSHPIPQRRTLALARIAAVAALVVAALMPIAPTVLAGNPGPALGQCAPTLSCALFTINLGGSGAGFAESSDITTGVPDGHIDCHLLNGAQTGSCSYLYSWPAGTGTYKIHLDAAPAMGNVVCFTNGTCLDEGHSTPLPFTLSAGVPETYAINFKPALRTLDVEAVFESGVAQSHVVKATNIESIDCPPTCTWQYDYGTSVDLQATTPDGFAFVGGFDACQGPSMTCTVTMTDDLTAGFTFITYTLVLPSPRATPGAHKSAPPAGASATTQAASASPVGSTVPSTADVSEAPVSTAQGGPSPASATTGDPLVVALFGVIAVLLVVVAIGLLVLTRRRAA